MPVLRRRRIKRFAILVSNSLPAKILVALDFRAALSYGLITEAPLNFRSGVLIYDGFVLASMTSPFVANFANVDWVREQFVEGSAREGSASRA